MLLQQHAVLAGWRLGRDGNETMSAGVFPTGGHDVVPTVWDRAGLTVGSRRSEGDLPWSRHHMHWIQLPLGGPWYEVVHVVVVVATTDPEL